MKTFFTSDTHFYHTNIIEYCNRPFSDVQDMNDKMINNWNSVVGPNDLVYHLGDYCFGNEQKIREINSRLNGHIVLVHGNHDERIVKDSQYRNNYRQYPISDRFQAIVPFLEAKVEGTTITMCHFALKVWNRSHHGKISLYGHSHGTHPGNSQQLDVGSDCWDYKPVTLEQILARLKTLPKYNLPDYHNSKTNI